MAASSGMCAGRKARDRWRRGEVGEVGMDVFRVVGSAMLGRSGLRNTYRDDIAATLFSKYAESHGAG